MKGAEVHTSTPSVAQAASSWAMSDCPPHSGPSGPVSGIGGPPSPIVSLGCTLWSSAAITAGRIAFGVIARPDSRPPGSSGW